MIFHWRKFVRLWPALVDKMKADGAAPEKVIIAVSLLFSAT